MLPIDSSKRKRSTSRLRWKRSRAERIKKRIPSLKTKLMTTKCPKSSFSRAKGKDELAVYL